MIFLLLVVFGLCLGSFVNALVWRVHEQEVELEKKKPRKRYLKDLSITKGRSMCPDCKHELASKDLVPVLSWLSTKGRCRYCKEPISKQYPFVEVATALLFVISYVYWPHKVVGLEAAIFALWCLLLTGFMALTVYDIKWYLLPNKIMLPLACIGLIMAVLRIMTSDLPVAAAIDVSLAVAIGGGIFYVLFQISKGKWIGGGDVKLGWLLGLVVATPLNALLVIFLASILGTIVSVPLMATGKLQRGAVVPFGPFLIAAAVIAVLFGLSITNWYQRLILGY